MSLVKRRIIGSSFPFNVGTGYGTVVVPTPAWFTLWERSLAGGSDGSGWSGYTDRIVILPYSSGGYDRINNGTQLRITLQAAGAGALSWDNIYIGNAATSGDAWDFDGTQVQVLFSGSASGSIAAGTTGVSDTITYAFDASKSLVMSMHHTSTSLRIRPSTAGINRAYQTPASDTAAVTDVTYNINGPGDLTSITKVEAFGYGSTETYAVKQFFDRITTPTSGRATAYRDLITGLVQDDVWAKIDGLYVLAAADEATARTNLKQTSYGLTDGGSSGTPPGFVADQGFAGLGGANDRWLETGFNPNTAGGNYAVAGAESSMMAAYVTSTASGTYGIDIGLLKTPRFDQIGIQSSTVLWAGIESDITVSMAITTAQGSYLTIRNSSSSTSVYKNGGSVLDSRTIASDGVNAGKTIGICGAVGFSTPSSRRIAAAMYGGGGFISNAIIQAYLARINTYMTALGINVY